MTWNVGILFCKICPLMYRVSYWTLFLFSITSLGSISKERCVFSSLGLDVGMALATSIGSGLELLHNSGSVIAHILEKRITFTLWIAFITILYFTQGMESSPSRVLQESSQGQAHSWWHRPSPKSKLFLDNSKGWLWWCLNNHDFSIPHFGKLATQTSSSRQWKSLSLFSYLRKHLGKT